MSDTGTPEKLYRIVRYYQGHPSGTIARGLTLEEARAHCTSTETSSDTCELLVNIHHTTEWGPWFDGYTFDGYAGEE